jgi:DNA repair protein RecO (recombination protein O)
MTIDEGIVVNVRTYQSTSKIVRIFSRQAGLITLFFSGGKKSKSVGLLYPLSLIEFGFERPKKGNLFVLKQISELDVQIELQSNIIKTSLAFFYAEVLNNILHEGEAQNGVFEFCRHEVIKLEKAEKCGYLTIDFLIGLSAYLGFQPDILTSSKYFNWREGTFQDYYAAQDTWEEWSSKYLKSFDGEKTRLSNQQRGNLISLLVDFYGYHLEGFYPPKSLEVIKEVLG